VRPRRTGRTAVRPGGASNFAIFRVAFRLPAIFALFCLIMPTYLDILGTQFTPNTLPFAFYLHLSFRLALERERGSGEELRGIRCGALIERFKNRHLDEQFLPLLLSFLISSLCLVILL